jgi:hypothetical protein
VLLPAFALPNTERRPFPGVQPHKEAICEVTPLLQQSRCTLHLNVFELSLARPGHCGYAVTTLSHSTTSHPALSILRPLLFWQKNHTVHVTR